MIYNLRDIERDGPSGSIADSVLIIRMKARRNGLLKQSDWTQTPDNPISNKAAYATWRQQLRDFPASWTPAETVDFPDEPT
jgi:hypothetical protein